MAAGAAGVGIAVGIVAAAGGLGNGGTTTRELLPATETPSDREPASFAHTTAPLTIHQIYERAAPGVVQVTATRVTKVPDPFFDPFGFAGPQTSGRA